MFTKNKKYAIATKAIAMSLFLLAVGSISSGANSKIVQALSNEAFLEAVKLPNNAKYGSVTSASEVAMGSNLASIFGEKRAKFLTRHTRFKNGIVRGVEVKYKTNDGKVSVVQVVQSRWSKQAYDLFTADKPKTVTKVYKNKRAYLKTEGNIAGREVSNFYVYIKSQSPEAVEMLDKKLASALRKVKKEQLAGAAAKFYKIKPLRKELKELPNKGFMHKTAYKSFDPTARDAVEGAVGNEFTTISYKIPKRAKIILVSEEEFNKAKIKNPNKIAKDVRGFLKKYSNRFRFFKVAGGQWMIMGRYKGYIMGIVGKKKKGAKDITPKRLKATLESFRIKFIFGSADGSADDDKEDDNE